MTRATRTLAALILACGLAWAQEPQQQIVFNFRDASLDQVLQYLSRATGLTFRTEVEVEGTITAVQATPMSQEQALEFLGSWLAERGRTLVRIGTIVKIIDAAEAPRSAVPVIFGGEPENIKENELYVTQVIPLKYIDAETARNNFAPLVSPQAGSLLSDATSNTLIITDTSANIRRIATILAALDKQVATVTQVKVFQLINSDAAALKETLEELFESSGSAAQSSDPRQQMMQMFMRRGGRGGRGGDGGGDAGGEAGGGSGGFSQDIKFSVEERTNSLIVSGSDDQIALVESLVADLDAVETDNENIFVYRLVNADAATVADLLTSVLDDSGTASNAAGGNDNNQGGGRNTGGGGRFQQFMQAVQTETSATGLSGNIVVTPDEEANALVIRTSPRNWERLEPILKKLDAPKAQVMIECLIAEVIITDGFEFGIEWSILDDLHIGEKLVDWQVGSDYGLSAQPNGTTYQLSSANYNMLVRTLQTDGRLNVLSTPKILALDNQEAHISVGQEVPFIRNSRITQDGDVLNTVEYEDIGIILNVTPHVNDLGFVRLEVAPEISVVAPASDAVQISEGVIAPVFEKTEAETQVMVMDGMTVAIGGLIRDTERETIQKIPILGDIPLLGHLFTSTNIEKEKVELVIFLTPHIVYDEVEMEAMSERQVSMLRFLDELLEKEMFKQEHGADALEAWEEQQHDATPAAQD